MMTEESRSARLEKVVQISYKYYSFSSLNILLYLLQTQI